MHWEATMGCQQQWLDTNECSLLCREVESSVILSQVSWPLSKACGFIMLSEVVVHSSVAFWSPQEGSCSL